MKSLKGLISLSIIFGLVFMLGACGGKVANLNQSDVMDAAEKEAKIVRVTDALDRLVEVPKNPENIAVLTPTILNLLYDVGGKASARMSDAGVAINPEAKDIEDVGHLANINIEKLVSLKPDLVIGQVALHERFVETLEQNGIPVVILKIDTYDEVVDNIKLMSKIIDKPENGEQVIKDLEERVKVVTDKLPDEKKRIAIVYVTSQEVTVELGDSIAGATANILGFKNVAESSKTKGMKRTPFSMEELVAQNPDVIFITSYAQTPDIQQKMKNVLMDNPAWNTIKAVEEERVHQLPPKYFAVNPAAYYDKSVEYMAKTVYPEIYGHVED